MLEKCPLAYRSIKQEFNVAYKKREIKGAHKLPVKKIMGIYPSLKNPNMFRIGYDEGGVPPKEASSEFNSRKAASKFLKVYLENYEKEKPYIDHVRDKEYAKAESKDGK